MAAYPDCQRAPRRPLRREIQRRCFVATPALRPQGWLAAPRRERYRNCASRWQHLAESLRVQSGERTKRSLRLPTKDFRPRRSGVSGPLGGTELRQSSAFQRRRGLAGINSTLCPLSVDSRKGFAGQSVNPQATRCLPIVAWGQRSKRMRPDEYRSRPVQANNSQFFHLVLETGSAEAILDWPGLAGWKSIHT